MPFMKHRCDRKTMNPDYMRSVSSPSSSSNGSNRNSSTVKQLEYISARVIDLIRTHNWTHKDWKLYVAENFTTYAPAAFLEQLSNPTTTTRQAYIDNYKAFADANPEYDCEPVSIEADVDEKEGTAKVWIVMSVTGHPPSVRKESVTILFWVRTDDRWVLVKQVGIRGFQAY